MIPRPPINVEGGRGRRECGRALPADLLAAIESAILSRRADGDDGFRTAVLSHALGGAFYFSRETAAERFRKHFRGLSPEDYSRAVQFLESRVRLVHAPYVQQKRRDQGWLHGWRADSSEWFGAPR